MNSVQTPLPYIFCVHLKQCVSLYLFALPFTLVDVMGWRMVPLVSLIPVEVARECVLADSLTGDGSRIHFDGC